MHRFSKYIFNLIISCLLLITCDWILAKNKNIQNSPVSLGRASASRPQKAFLNHSTNNLWSSVTNYGSVGDPNSPATGRPSAQWPGGSGNNYLYDAGIWVGTKLGGEPVVTTYFYNPHQEWDPTPGFPGELGSFVDGTKSRSLEDSYVVYDDGDDNTASEHVPIGIKINQRGLTWSLPDFDDFIAFEYYVINTGLNGDLEDVFVGFWYDIDVSSSDDTEPHIDDLVDYDGWDGLDSDTDNLDGVDPYDLDGDGLTGYDEWGVPYIKDQPQNPNYDLSKSEPDGFYDEWAVILDSKGQTLYWQSDVEELSRYVGQPAIVNGNTLKGWQFPRSLSYIYDGDHPTSSGNDYGEREKSPPNDGFLGGALIYTSAEPNVVGNDSSYIGAYSHQWWNWESDPMDVDKDKLDYIYGQNVASLGKRFLNNPLELGFPQFDYRFLQSTGPFDIAEGDTVKIVFAMVCGQGLRGLRENADNAIVAYYSGSTGNPLNPTVFDADVHWNLPIPPESPGLSYSPISGGIKTAWDTRAESSYDANLGKIDFEGYQLYRAAYNPQEWELIYAFDNLSNSPVYVVNIDGDTINKTDANGDWIKIDLPDISNQFDDTGGTTPWGETVSPPLDGIPYYYAVSAYDGYKSAEEAGQELFPSYSPLSNYRKSEDNAPIPVYFFRFYERGQDIPPLSSINVVPNPYRGSAQWEVQYEDRIKFHHLPPVCKISIFSLAGDLVKEIKHHDGSDVEYWDLVSRNNQSIVSGVYIYVVEAPDVSLVGETSKNLKKHIGKFAIFR